MAECRSTVWFDVKPYDTDTDMKKIEKEVRNIAMDGLKWAASRLQDVAYGIKKLQINAIIYDEKVPSTDVIVEQIESMQQVQSVDIASFNKL